MSTFQAYLIEPPVGPREWGTVKAECERRARELGGTCTPIDVPATKVALIPFLNELEARQVAPPATIGELEASPPLESPPPANDDDDEAVKFDARVLEAQVERLGELGDRGLDELEHIQTFGGVGGSFSRGVHLLTIIAAGEHQLARLFLRRQRGAK